MVPALGPIKLCARAGNYSPFAVDFLVKDRMPIELASVCRVNGTFSIGLSFSGWNNNFFYALESDFGSMDPMEPFLLKQIRNRGGDSAN